MLMEAANDPTSTNLRTAFLAKVQRGVYCAPTREKGCLPKWHRLKLDRDIARRHGLRFDNIAVAEDVTELI